MTTVLLAALLSLSDARAAAVEPPVSSSAAVPAADPSAAVSPPRRRRGAAELLQEAAVKAAAGDLAGARSLVERAVWREPENAQARLLRASVALKMGDLQAAESDASKALELGLEQPAPYLARSEARSRSGRFQEALDDADKALGLNLASAEGRLARATALEGLKRPAEDVVAEFAKAADIDPRFRQLHDEARARLLPSAPEPVPAPAMPRWWAALAVVGLAVAGGVSLLLGRALRGGEAKLVRFGSVMTSSSSSPAAEPRVGAVVGGHYVLGRLLESTDALAVYEGRDLSDVSKTLVRYRGGARWLEKVKAAQELAGPGIASCEEAFAEGPALYLAYQPMAGESLRRLLEKLPGRRQTPEQALRVVKSVCDALEAAHGKGLLHGHLNPSAIVVEKGQVRVRDFGLLPQGAEKDYMAPEQEREESGRESDLFSLGVCVYELLTGALPFTGPEASRDRRAGTYPPASTLLRGAPAGLDPFFARALNPDPSARFHAAPEVFLAFRSVAMPAVE